MRESGNARMREYGSRIYIRIVGMGVPGKERSGLEQTVKTIGGTATFIGNSL